MTERRQVRYRGRVQGVGFRATTRQVASRYLVTGYVQNLPDGQVLTLVEGEAAELDRFLGEIQSRMGQFIHEAQVDRLPATGEFDEFDIRYF